MTPIDQAKNLGPTMAYEFNQCGFKSLEDLVSHGVEESFLSLIEHFPNRVNLNCLCAIYGAVHDMDWRQVPEEEKSKLKSFLAKTKKLYDNSSL